MLAALAEVGWRIVPSRACVLICPATLEECGMTAMMNAGEDPSLSALHLPSKHALFPQLTQFLSGQLSTHSESITCELIVNCT